MSKTDVNVSDLFGVLFGVIMVGCVVMSLVHTGPYIACGLVAGYFMLIATNSIQRGEHESRQRRKDP